MATATRFIAVLLHFIANVQTISISLRCNVRWRIVYAAYKLSSLCQKIMC